jgi:hypothetical protein
MCVIRSVLQLELFKFQIWFEFKRVYEFVKGFEKSKGLSISKTLLGYFSQAGPMPLPLFSLFIPLHLGISFPRGDCTGPNRPSSQWPLALPGAACPCSPPRRCSPCHAHRPAKLPWNWPLVRLYLPRFQSPLCFGSVFESRSTWADLAVAPVRRTTCLCRCRRAWPSTVRTRVYPGLRWLMPHQESTLGPLPIRARQQQSQWRKFPHPNAKFLPEDGIQLKLHWIG